MSPWLAFVFGIVGLFRHVGGGNSTQTTNNERSAGGYRNKYDNYVLMRIFPMNEQQVQFVTAFNDPMAEVEVLKHSRGFNNSLDILVPPSRLQFINNMFNANRFRIQKTDHYGRKFEYVEQKSPRGPMEHFDVFKYHAYWEIRQYINRIAKLHPTRVQIQYLGESYEKRPMPLVKISVNPSAGNPVILVDAGIHAREWVTPAMSVYLIHRLATDVYSNLTVLNGVDWYIIPVVNPDGYEFTRKHQNNRMWRKTRSKQGTCYGVDGNRNYGFKWGGAGISHDPCDKQIYAGPRPFSEPEIRLVRNVMEEYEKRIKLYVSMHSYGQLLLYPWGYTSDILPKGWKRLEVMAHSVSNAVQRAGGRPFKVLSSGKWYEASGISQDFAFGAIGIPYSFTMELTDDYEFIFPEHLLRNALPPFYAGFEDFAAQIRRIFG